ncbi:MAG TPA: DUF2726 domain-containing protein [Polaromonas sp.]|uniref:DUF2726 domain-containing protein n=1 Tax=Polaromonas sp. TaxID=1869339 RepID=UPI002D662BD8|nr:DUF2726 domain-containing protein [Polaromonas sp.]HYW58299.1 DUF2726 domain-containing protein [Polaromonas sp.]
MLNLSLPALALAAASGMAVGVLGFRSWAARAARKKKRLPDKWQLQARPLLTDTEHEVWHWLKSAFFDHHVLVKIPVIRFMAPRTEAVRIQTHVLLSGVYCTFTVCAADGTAIGCIDLPGPRGLKASNRNLKQKLFAECGMAYAVVRASNLPTLEAVRAEFLGEIELPDGGLSGLDPSPLDHWKEGDGLATEPAPMRSASGVVLQDARGLDVQGIDMNAIAEARSSLRAKLERNRKIRVAGFDPLSTSSGIVQDNADQNFAQAWEDSFTPIDDEGESPPASP